MTAKEIFFNPFGRLRSGWRAVAFAVLFVLLAILTNSIWNLLLLLVSTGMTSGDLLSYVGGFSAALAAAILAGGVCLRLLEGLPFRALGASFSDKWLKDFLLGMAGGALSMIFAAFILLAFGGMHFEINENSGSAAVLLTLGATLLIFTAGGAFEEAFFRGYVLQTFTRSGHIAFAVLLTSILFATAHNQNPAASWFSWINTLLAGVWFAAAYLKTRTLWFAFGLHLAWNWVQGALLGIPVSGLQELANAPVLRATDAGPAWLTGGGYGVEGGAACTIALIVSTIVIWFAPFLKPTDRMLELTERENALDTVPKAAN